MLLLASSLLIVTKAQTFTYTFYYDLSGNRTQRTCILLKSGTSESIFDSENNSLNKSYVHTEKHEEYIDETLFTFYPNPTGGELVIRFDPIPENVSGFITVIGLDGRSLVMVSPLSEFNHLDLTDLSAGNYILRLELDGNIKTFEIIKE